MFTKCQNRLYLPVLYKTSIQMPWKCLMKKATALCNK